MKDLNCPNCGAPITGDKCEYCGTVFNANAAEEVTDDNIIVKSDDMQILKAMSEVGFPINDLRRGAGLPPLIKER